MKPAALTVPSRSNRAALVLRACLLAILFFSNRPTHAADAPLRVGAAQIDITPDYPIRLSGFGFRRTESEGVTQRIWAKALVFADETEGPAVLITTDNLCVPDEITEEIATRLKPKIGLKRERLTIAATHTHTAPMLKNTCPTLFGLAIPAEHQANIDRYTREFTDKLEQAALAAVKDIQPAHVSWGNGTVGFAINRRTKGGPVDHDLPVLVVRNVSDQVRAIYFSYACHCVTLSNNKISGDWAGFAQEAVQKLFPGSVALASVGCGADSNPDSGVAGDNVAACAKQGQQIADEVKRLLGGLLTPITAKPITRFARVDLPFDTPRTRAEWEERAKSKDAAIAFHAQGNLARLDRGETLPTKLSYPIQTWLFADQLAVVFLPGETVVDYSLRLKRELDRSRLWVNGYANEARCYIPSERVLKEGGYEGGHAMIYYDMPQRFAPGLEQKIIDTIHAQVPKSFAAPKGTEGTRPLSSLESLRAIRTKPGLTVELVAAEPLIVDPVAIDWGADGKLWVCEMHDYPTGLDEQWQPGGRVKFLEDTDGDGRYDKATIFVDGLPFPTGVTAWGKGVFISAAPDILYAEDTDGDGKPDKVEKFFTGFPTDNYQARVNSLSLGLDNWIYGANGLLGATIRGVARPLGAKGVDAPSSRRRRRQESLTSGSDAPRLETRDPVSYGNVDIRNRDFRFDPDTGTLESASGLTQQGRVRDDWGNWFGCDNSRLLLHFPMPEHYTRRNRHVPAPDPIVHLSGRVDGNRLFPSSRLLERFNDPGHANQTTSACGLGLYRDTLLGEEYYGNAFICEPVHNLVHREVLTRDGVTFTSHRATDERESEFFASTDNWFRPVQVRTGPDGALYVVDMYRFLIEHPRWVPATRLAQIDARAGADKGRIYRLRPVGKPLRPVRDLTKLGAGELAIALDTPNGTERDRVHTELLVRRDQAALRKLEQLAASAALPSVRVQALSALEGLDGLKPAQVESALKDAHPEVRQQAVRLCEPFFRGVTSGGRDLTRLSRRQAATLLSRTDDTSAVVVHQLALTLGQWGNDPRAGRALAHLAKTRLNDPHLRTAILSSAVAHCGEILDAVMSIDENTPGRSEWIAPLVATAAASNDDRLFARALSAVLPPVNATAWSSHFVALASLLDALDRKRVGLADYLARRPELRDIKPRLENTLASAGRLAADATAPEPTREAAVKLLGRGLSAADDLALLSALVTTGASDKLRGAALAALRRQRSAVVAEGLLAKWQQTSPSTRTEIVNLLLGRDEWMRALLQAVDDGRVQSREIALSDRQRLAQSANHEIQQLAAKLVPAQPATNRTKALQHFQTVLSLPGRAPSGAEIFSKNCAACHVLGGMGHDVGPNLATLGDKDADYWLKNILDPNAIVEPRFVSYQVELKDERSLSGIIKAETATSLVLASGSGVTETLLRSDVADIRASSLSMMPEGLEQGINVQEMADLIAFLKSSRAPKQFAGNKPEIIRPSADGSLLLPARQAEIYGNQIAFEKEFKNIGMWYDREDHVAWTAQIDKPATFDVHIDYACAGYSAGNRFLVSAGSQSVTGLVAATGSDWSQYRQAKIGSLRLEAGQQRITVRPESTVREALVDLRTVALTQPGAQPSWPAPRPPADNLPRDPASLTRVILDSSQLNAAREAAINANPQFASELITEMTRDLTPGTPAEYERIPWIWRVAVACGRRNDDGQMKRVLDVSLPKFNEPLRDWQAVVIGGGIINGLSQRGLWPAERVAELFAKDDSLRMRWQRTLELAAEMADNNKVPNGTRYDALRMLGVEPWTKRGAHLVRYLAKGIDDELQMGAVSGLVDVNSPDGAKALILAWENLSKKNRSLALDGLLRDDQRVGLLLDAVVAGQIQPSDLGESRTQKLVGHGNEAVRKRAMEVFSTKSR